MKTLNIDKTKTATLCGTLNDKIDLPKNTGYTPTFKLAFDAFIDEIGTDYVIRDKSLQSLNSYTFREIPLNEDEYEKNIKKKDNELKVKVSFQKELPFENPSRISEEPFIFDGKELCHFKPRRRPELLYYKNSDDFAISLTPNDETQEIVLMKSPFPSETSFGDIFQTLQENKESSSLDLNAEIKIPLIELDWLTNHPEIKNRKLEKSAIDFWKITEVEEGLSFSLTNTGAKVKSYLALEGAWNCVIPEKPHQIIFDKPFVVFLKKEDISTPYFAAYIADATFLRAFDLEEVKKENKAIQLSEQF